MKEDLKEKNIQSEKKTQQTNMNKYPSVMCSEEEIKDSEKCWKDIEDSIKGL